MNQGQKAKKKGCDLCGLTDVGNWKEHQSGRKHQFLEQQRAQREMEKNGLYISGIPPGIDIKVVQRMLSSYGKITDFYHHPTKHFVLVSFKKRETADAVLFGHVLLGNTRLVVKRRRQRFPQDEPNFSKDGDYPQASVDHSQVEKVLSSGGSMQDFLKVLEVPEEERENYNKLVNDLEALIMSKFKKCKAQVFGSISTGLCITGSDIDVFVEIENAAEQLSNATAMPLSEKLVRIVQRLMHQQKEKFTQIRPIARAKTPIIKFIHAPTGVSCDVSFKNSLGVANSKLIKHYIALDKRVYPYFMIIKYWARKHNFSGSGKITNYALVTLSAYYLQQLDDPVLPTVHKLQDLSKEKKYVDSWLCSFNDDPKALSQSKNTSSVFELLAGFFNYYSTLNIGDLVICPYLGKTVPKVHFVNTENLPEPLKTIYLEEVSTNRGLHVISDLCVQDPFELSHNVTACTGTQALKLFQAFTKVATEVFKEILEAPDAKKLSILNKLFTTQPEIIERASTYRLSDSEMTLTIFAYGFLSLSLFIDKETPLKEEVDEAGVARKWFPMIYNLVLDIFVKIMRFEVQTVENPTINKVMKMESPSDVHDIVNMTNSQKKLVDVKGYYRMWEDRKNFQKMLGELPKSHCLNIEEAVSNELYKVVSALPKPKKPILNFTCEFIDCMNPPSVKLLCKDKGSDKGLFHQAMSYLQARIPSFIEKYCKYMKQKARMEKKAAAEAEEQEEENSQGSADKDDV